MAHGVYSLSFLKGKHIITVPWTVSTNYGALLQATMTKTDCLENVAVSSLVTFVVGLPLGRSRPLLAGVSWCKKGSGQIITAYIINFSSPFTKLKLYWTCSLSIGPERGCVCEQSYHHHLWAYTLLLHGHKSLYYGYSVGVFHVDPRFYTSEVVLVWHQGFTWGHYGCNLRIST